MTAVPTPDAVTVRNGNPATVFLSYSSQDRDALPGILAALEDAGFAVWWDGLIAGGEVFAKSIEGPLQTARAVVVLWSQHSIASHWVRDEAVVGRDRARLVPLSLDGVEPPLGFRQVQTISLKGDRQAALGAMLRAVAALHDLDPDSITVPKRRGVALSTDRRSLLIGGAGMLAVAGAAGAWWRGWLGGTGASANSVAVLPFDNFSGAADESYFSDGLAAEVRTELAGNPLLQVAAQTSSNKFRDSKDDARAITQALGVSYLLDGSVRRADKMVRVAVELIEGASGFSRWSQTFDRPLANIFAVQEEIAGAVTKALTRQLIAHQGGGGASTVGTENLAAYDAFLRGRDLYDRAATQDQDLAALAMFDRAVAADPGYAVAQAARALSLTVIGNQYDQGPTRHARYAAAIAAARRGVELAAENPETQSALGFALFNGHVDARAARAPYEESFDLGKGNADVMARFALYSARCGRFEPARSAVARAAKLDPLNARSFRVQGDVEYAARNFAASIPPAEHALVLNPDLSVAHAAIGASRFMLGQIEAARAQYAAEPSSLFRLTGLAIIEAKLGLTAAAKEAMASLIANHGDNSLYQQAQILAQWGQPAAAIDKLIAAENEGDAGLVYVNTDPFVDPLRRDPRFISLSRNLGFA